MTPEQEAKLAELTAKAHEALVLMIQVYRASGYTTEEQMVAVLRKNGGTERHVQALRNALEMGIA